MTDVVLYPRGFYGYDAGLPKIDTTPSAYDTALALMYRKNIRHGTKDLVTNDEVNKLYQLAISHGPGVNTIAYRERLLLVALKAFGTTSFYDWCKLQDENENLNGTHVRFLNDTLQFIAKGTRSTSISNWERIVSTKAKRLATSGQQFLYKDFFKLNQVALFRRPLSITNTIQSWVSQPGGYEDLVRTLYILFCKPEGE